MPLTPPDRRPPTDERATTLLELARVARQGEAAASASKVVLDKVRLRLEQEPDDGQFREKALHAMEMQSVTLMTEGAYFLGRASGLETAARVLEGGPGARDA